MKKYTDDDLVQELHNRGFHFIDETDKEDMIEFLEERGHEVCLQNNIESELDIIDEQRLDQITEKFISGSWAEREEMYKNVML